MKRVAMFIIMGMVLLFVAACGKQEEESSKNTTMDFYKSDEEVFEINSKHCPLFFPTKWKDMVSTKVQEEETTYKVSFFAKLGSESLPLYEIVFGDSTEGYLLGTVQTEAGMQSVYIVDTFSYEEGSLPENLELTYYEMCEGINDIISNLVYKNGMTIEG